MNYSGVIEAYRNVDMKRLSVYDKYIFWKDNKENTGNGMGNIR